MYFWIVIKLQEEFCNKVYQIKDELNQHLKILHKPLLEGSYFAIGKRFSELNCIVNFGNSYGLLVDYYDNDELAKIRYIGKI